MESDKRRNAVKDAIEQTTKPISASALAKQFSVSRQIIVGDVALLRAQGCAIIATPRGYVMESKESGEGVTKTIVVTHRPEDLQDEIYTIIDLGGAMIDVIVEHPLYGQLSGKLHIFSRYDADRFFEKLKKKAINDCIQQGILADYLKHKGSEVTNMLIAEYSYEEDIQVK